MQECLSSYHLAFLVRRGSPYTSLFNQKIQRLVEAGFVSFWKDSSRYSLDLVNTIKLHKTGIKVRDVQLTLKNCYVWFLIALVGHFFAAIVFICEVLYSRRKKFTLKRHPQVVMVTSSTQTENKQKHPTYLTSVERRCPAKG